MWIKRDFLDNFNSASLLEAILIRGPRQIGKSSILRKIEPPAQSEAFLDDVTLRTQANEDADFLISQFNTPLLLDEVQLAPSLFPALKKQIDQGRRKRMDSGIPVEAAKFRLTGSNQSLLDKNVKESLAGRVSQFYLLGLSFGELMQFKPELKVSEVLLRGGFPELWVRPELNPMQYLNDYISTFIEKDIARVAGIEKIGEFLKTLKFLAARTGELLNYEALGSDAGIAGKTVKEWISLLERNQIVLCLPAYSTNLNNRLIKMPKTYFLDLGLCVRLQGHQDTESLLFTPLGGHLFETLVVSEVVKTKLNFKKDWHLSFWRTKEKEEIDLIVETEKSVLLLEIKLNAHAFRTPPVIPKAITMTKKEIRTAVVIATNPGVRLQSGWQLVPIAELREFLLQSPYGSAASRS